jgi:hypothetical protein
VAYLALRDHHALPAIAVETLATEARDALQPGSRNLQTYGPALNACRKAASVCAELGDSTRDKHCRNLIQSLLPDNLRGIEPSDVRTNFNTLWKKFALE